MRSQQDAEWLVINKSSKSGIAIIHKVGCGAVVPELLRTLVFARPCGGDQFAAGTVSPSLDMSR